MGGTAQKPFRTRGIAKRRTDRKARTAHAHTGREPSSACSLLLKFGEFTGVEKQGQSPSTFMSCRWSRLCRITSSIEYQLHQVISAGLII